MELFHHAFARTLYRFLLMCCMFVVAGIASAATIYLPATSTTGNFTISWTSGINPISVYENTAAGAVLLAQAGPNSFYNVTGKPNGTYAYYVVECKPNGPSAPICTQSNYATITVTLPSQNPAPAAPASVSASSGGSTASISWPAVPAATSYNILRNAVMLNTVGATSYTDNGLAPGSYTYQVQACNGNGCSGTTASNAITITLPIPAAPPSVSVSSGIGYAYASWPAVSGATSYSVQRSFSMAAPTNTTATDYADYAVTAGNSYSYDVRACNASGCSDITRSNAVTVAPPVPATPTGISAAPSGGAMSIAWNATSGASSYTIQKIDGASVTETPNITTTSYADTSVSAASTYTYSVKACNSSGCSSFSAGATTTTPVAVPAAPAPVSAVSGAGGGYAYVSWPTVSGATYYAVQRSFSMTAPVSTTASNYADSSVTVGNSYSYDVKACNGSGCSAVVTSNAVTIAAPLPATPTGLSASASAGVVSLSWSAASGASSYTLQKNAGGVITEIAGITATGHADASVTHATTYTYSVKACNGSGCSAFSASASATTPVAVPAAPASATASSGSGGGFAYVSWSPVSGATSYRVQQQFSMTAPVPTTATNYADTAVTVGNSYSYLVQACNASGCSAAVTTNSVTIAPTIPVTPAGVTAAPSGSAISVGWTASAGATSYTIQKTAGATVTEMANVSGTVYSDAGVTPATTYSYSVKACNVTGCSAVSVAASATANIAVPAAPLTVTATSGTGGGFAYVSWTGVSGATSYSVQRVASMTAPISTAATNYADTTVTVGNSYSYQVQACNTSGCSAVVASNAVTIAPPVPAVPTGVTAAASGSAISVGWTATAGATSYTIQKTAGATVTSIANLTGTSYADTSVTPGTLYTYHVKACNSSGCSAISAAASATAAVAVPAAPATVTATSGTGGGFAYVSWTAVSGATSYSVQRVASMTAPISTTATNYADSTVTVGNTYSYQVKACNASGCSAIVTSNAATIAAPAPATPTGLIGTPGDTSNVLGWTAVSGATSYSLQRTPTSASFPVNSIATTSYTDAGLAAATAYSYNVRACNSAGCSAWSAALTVTTRALAIPAQPASLSVAQVLATVRLSWPSVANATLYKLKRSHGAIATALPDAISTSATDASVAVDVNYLYQVQACNSGGCSAWTVSASIKVPHIPAPPTLVGAVVRQDAIFVTWPNNDNATSAKLTRNAAQISSAASSPYTDANVTAGTVYTYGVSACNATGCSAATSSAAVTAGVPQAGVRVIKGYVYNVLGRLTNVNEDGSPRTQYDYDSAGNRKQVNE